MRMLVAVLCLLIAAPTADAKRLSITKADFILVEKANRTLTLYKARKPIKTYRIALGGNPEGHKEQEGDSRTPEGRYIIDAKNPKSSFHLSLHISYPNKKDIASARRRGVDPGGAIMIHGTPGYLGTLQDVGIMRDWTAGCIAVSIPEIEEIYRNVRIGTPILIKP